MPLSDAVNNVLTSPDLLPLIGSLEMEDHAAASVCTEWAAAWQEDNEWRKAKAEFVADYKATIENLRTSIAKAQASGLELSPIIDMGNGVKVNVLLPVPIEYIDSGKVSYI